MSIEKERKKAKIELPVLKAKINRFMDNNIRKYTESDEFKHTEELRLLLDKTEEDLDVAHVKLRSIGDDIIDGSDIRNTTARYVRLLYVAREDGYDNKNQIDGLRDSSLDFRNYLACKDGRLSGRLSVPIEAKSGIRSRSKINSLMRLSADTYRNLISILTGDH
jgi:hypothetical protein